MTVRPKGLVCSDVGQVSGERQVHGARSQPCKRHGVSGKLSRALPCTWPACSDPSCAESQSVSPSFRAAVCELQARSESLAYFSAVSHCVFCPPRPAHPHRPSLPPVSELPEAPRYQFRTALSSLFLPSLLPSLGASVSPDVRPSVFCKQDRAGGSQVPGAHECPLIC